MRVGSVAAGAGRQCAPAALDLAPLGGPSTSPLERATVVLLTPAKIVGATGAVAGVLPVLVAGVAVARTGVQYIAFVLVGVCLVGVLAAGWFKLLLPWGPFGATRIGMCMAGALSAVATNLTFIALFSIPEAIVSGSSWLGTFHLYAQGSLVSRFLLGILAAGALGGLLASTRRFAL